MNRKALTGLALGLSLSLAQAAPASAGAVYVPVLPPAGNGGSLHATEVWVSNPGGQQRAFASTFIPAGSNGTQRTGSSPEIPVPARRTFLLSNVGNGSGLLELLSNQEISVEARLTSTSPNGLQTYATVPVISSANTIAANGVAQILGLERDGSRGNLSHLGVVNLGTTSAQCEIKVFRVDGTQIGGTTSLSFQALSLRQFDDALGILGEQKASDVRIHVSCNKPFYAYAALLTQPHAQLTFRGPSGTTAVSGGGGNGGTDPGTGTGKSVVFQKAGHLHTAAPGNPKGKLLIPIQSPMSLKRLVVECDFVPGPWNREKIPGNHAIIWLYRGKFRSNSVVNVNAFGPNKYTVKLNQNVDLPAGGVTSAEGGLQLEQGKRYRLRYVYDAQTNQITAEFFHNGNLLRTLRADGTATNHVLSVNPPSLNVEFGHNPGQEGPEIPSWGWSYHDLKVEMIQY